MKSFNNVLIIYPQDSTIDFLQPIVNKLLRLFPKGQLDRPKYGIPLQSIDDETELVIFLGHGTTRKLYGGANENGDKFKLCDIPNGARLLDNCAIVLFSCNSYDYLKYMQGNPVTIKTFIVFGDIPTDWGHIRHNQDNDNSYWSECDDEQLDYYKNALVESAIYGFIKASKTDSFYGFYKGVTHIINKKINSIIENNKWKKNKKLQLIERLIDFKHEIVYADEL